MVNKDMNGFPVKKCSAFQFFKKREFYLQARQVVRRWIKSPMVSVDKHQSPSLKYTGPSVMHIPPGEPDFESSLCPTCLGDHTFQRGVLPQEKESCSWETQPGCEAKEPCNHASILTKPDPRTFWTNDDSDITAPHNITATGELPAYSSFEIFWDFAASLGLGQKHKKGVFGSGSAVHKGHLFVLGLGAGNLARPESRRLLQGNVSVLPAPSPAARPPPRPMGEMQGALARARLESLLRPRHKKRVEAQKRSESFLLSGLAFMKQRRMGLNDFIQKIANNSYACKHPEVQSILKISQPQEPELMNANPSPPPSPSQQINLGPSSNPHAKPSDFHFLKVIGKGSFGKVLLARHKAEEAFYAVKVLQKKAILKKKEEKHIMSERNVLLKNVKHPFLVGLHFSFQTADKLYFVLDYINGGELFYHLQRERCFLEPRARFYAAEIASALGYLHSLNIVYRDLKPENILLDSQGHIVLTDFGLCKENIEHNGTTSTFCGTPEYLAPEVLHKQPYDRTVDWWCLGAVLYEMLYGLPPFYSRNTAEMYDNILNKPLQLKPNITNSARHLLEGLLQKDRTKRLGAKDDFMEIKNHVFFSLINWDDLINKKITPPFNPNVSGPSDLRHFDPEFTEEPVPNSIGRSPDSILLTASVKEAAEAFLGFSYAPPMDSFL